MFSFLSLPSFFSWLKAPATTVITIVTAVIRLIFYWINSILYRSVRSLYNVFIALCNGQLLDNETLNSLFGRVGLLLGVIMMFRVAFSFIQVLINPDSFSDKEKGIPNIIKKSIIVIIMFGMSSYVFSLLKTVQSEIIESNVISKFLLPQQVETENFGGALEAELFTAFYNLDPALDYQTTNECASEDYINGLKNSIANKNSFSYKKQCVIESGTIKEDNSSEYFISFNYIFSTLVAIATIYFLLNYCISVGVRIIQLAALQIISPMAIVGYLSPKSDNMFTKWVKVYFSTYIDVFLRMAIINFAVYIIAILIQGFNDQDSVFFTSVGYAAGEHKKLIYIIMIMAIFTFAKKAPDLLKKIFPATSESGIGLGVDKGIGGTVAGAAAGGFIGGFGGATAGIKNGKGFKGKALGALSGITEGSLGGIGRGITGGYGKGAIGAVKSTYGSQHKANINRGKRIAEGGSTSSIASWASKGAAERSAREIEKLEAQNKTYNQFSDLLSASEDKAEKDILAGKFSQNRNAQKVFAAKAKMKSYEEQLKGLDPQKTSDAAKINSINSAMMMEQKNYTNSLKEAKRDYITSAVNGTIDCSQIKNNVAMANNIIGNNRDLAPFANVQEISNYTDFDNINNDVNNSKQSNSIQINNTQKKSEKISVNAKYNGK